SFERLPRSAVWQGPTSRWGLLCRRLFHAERSRSRGLSFECCLQGINFVHQFRLVCRRTHLITKITFAVELDGQRLCPRPLALQPLHLCLTAEVQTVSHSENRAQLAHNVLLQRRELAEWK